jgi:iron complex transport system ATP-binding protein
LVKIEIKSLSFGYSSHVILDDINMAVEDSKIASLVGPNDSGKTTLSTAATSAMFVLSLAV